MKKTKMPSPKTFRDLGYAIDYVWKEKDAMNDPDECIRELCNLVCFETDITTFASLTEEL